MLNLLKNYWDSYDYYGGYGNYYSDTFYNVSDEVVAIAVLVSFIVSIIVYFTFLSKRNKGRFTGFAGWLYEVLNFGKLIIEGFLKICYMFIALFFSILSIVHMKESFLEGIIYLIVFNIILRVCYEFLLMLVMLFKNTKEINSKLKNQNADNNTMQGGRNNYNMPPQQQYVQPPYGQQPYGQMVRNGHPMGMQQPTGQPVYQNQVRPQGMPQGTPVQQAPVQQTPMQPTPVQQAPVQPKQSEVLATPVQDELPKVQNVEYCPSCGIVIEHDDVFCPNCGTKVVK